MDVPLSGDHTCSSFSLGTNLLMGKYFNNVDELIEATTPIIELTQDDLNNLKLSESL